MRCKGRRLQFPVEVEHLLGLERDRIDLVGVRVLTKREQATVEIPGIGVPGVVALHDRGCVRVIVHRVPVHLEELLAGLPLRDQTFGVCTSSTTGGNVRRRFGSGTTSSRSDRGSPAR